MKTRASECARLVAGVALVALLSACGGGGGSETPAPPPVVQPTAIPDNLAITAPTVAEVSGATAFTNSAASLSGLTFAWDFGDGTTSAEPSPKHDYTKVGDFAVTLKVSNSAGTSKEVKFKLAINNRAVTSSLSCSGDNAGWCWQAPRPSGNSVNDLYFLSGQVGWTVGESGEIHKTTDGGKTWVRQVSGVTTSLTNVRFSDANNGWALGNYGAVLHTIDGGAHWSVQGSNLPDGYSSTLTAVNATTAVIMPYSGLIRATSDGGTTWSQFNVNSNATTVMPDGTLWAAAYDGVRKSTNLGKTWTLAKAAPVSGNTPALVVQGTSLWAYYQVYNYDPTKGVYYVTTIQRSTDNGATWDAWTPQGLPTDGSYGNALDFVDANTGAMAVNANLYRTTDGGRNWTKTDAPASGSYYYNVEHRIVVPGMRYRGFYDANSKFNHQVSEDAGGTWRTVSAPARYDNSSYYWQSARIQRVDAQTWVALAEAAVRVSTDGMKTWTVVRGQVSSDTPRNFNALWFFDAKRGLALSQYGEMLETKNAGLDWAVKLTGLPTNNYNGYTVRLQFVDANKGWLLTADGRLYLSTDGGDRWSAPLSSQNYAFRSFYFLDGNNGFATVATYVNGNYAARLLGTTDGGQSWTELSTLAEEYQSMYFSSTQQGVLVGNAGHIATTTDGGKTWVARFSGTNQTLLSVAAGETGLWAVGQSGVMVNSKDAGATWTQGPSLTTASLTKVRFLDARQGWAVGGSGTILSTQDGGLTWKAQNAGTRMSLSDVFFADSRTGWVSGDYGTLLVTGTGGQ